MADYYAPGQWDLADSRVRGVPPRDFPKSNVADDAQVKIGQSYSYAANPSPKALEALDKKAIRDYPNGKAIPDAYYKKGIALQSLGQRERAHEAFDVRRQDLPR